MIVGNKDGQPPDAAYCAKVREQYGLEMTVLYDPGLLLWKAFGTEQPDSSTVVLAEGSVMAFKDNYAMTSALAVAKDLLSGVER